MKEFAEFVSVIANVLTIVASLIAIYLFCFKGKYIASVFNVLVSYSSQLTLSELKEKLDLLNDLRATNQDDFDEIVNILHEITGQLKGNPKLTPHFKDLIEQISKATEGKTKITEPKKRAIVSEIREKIRHVGILNIENIAGEKQ